MVTYEFKSEFFRSRCLRGASARPMVDRVARVARRGHALLSLNYPYRQQSIMLVIMETKKVTIPLTDLFFLCRKEL